MTFTIKSNLIDLVAKEIYAAEIIITNNVITTIKKINETVSTYVLPGFVDAHVHVESSMLVPSEFARIAVTHGTVGTISDPHEIANVLGVAGVDYMIDNQGNNVFANEEFYCHCYQSHDYGSSIFFVRKEGFRLHISSLDDHIGEALWRFPEFIGRHNKGQRLS